MPSCIIVAPVGLLDEADSFAQAAGLPTGQFTAPYGDGHMLCAFTPGAAALAALGGQLPAWLQLITMEAPNAPAWDESKVGVFLSDALGGWVHQAQVDSWPRA